MEKFTSPDGVRLAYRRRGAGPPLVLVHGIGSAASRWDPLLPALGAHFSACALERRGRGQSGDGEGYALAREFGDVAALVDSFDRPADLLAHSFGGLCALGAALQARRLRRLILYEGIPVPGNPMFPPGIIEWLEALLEAGDREQLVTTFLREVVRLTPRQLEQFKAAPSWEARLAAAHTLPREMRAQVSFHFDPARYAALQVPTLLLLGGDSPAYVREATEAVDAVLPDSRIVVLPGQGHLAMVSAPDLLVREVLAFLNAPN